LDMISDRGKVDDEFQQIAPTAREGEIVKSPETVALAKEVWGAQGYDIEAEDGVLVTAEVDDS
jgi:hypothetical protein